VIVGGGIAVGLFVLEYIMLLVSALIGFVNLKI
jgi:hypothetical protein